MTKNHPIKRVLVIINPASGQAQPVLHTLNRVFTEAEIDWPVAITKGDGDAAQAAAQAASADVDAVAVYGGDGTVMEVANALHGTSLPMAILPGGTANVLSIELDVPGQLKAAARLITTPPPYPAGGYGQPGRPAVLPPVGGTAWRPVQPG